MMWWGSGWWLVGAVFMVICLVMMFRMVGHSMMGHGTMGHGSSAHEENDGPERTLANRLARGEINIEEYERLLEELRRTDSTAHT